jgi:hypothetical protein
LDANASATFILYWNVRQICAEANLLFSKVMRLDVEGFKGLSLERRLSKF